MIKRSDYVCCSDKRRNSPRPGVSSCQPPTSFKIGRTASKFYPSSFSNFTRDRCTNNTNPPRTHVLSATGTGYLCLSFVLGPISCTSILRFISVNRPRCTASTRQTNERYPKATANVLIDVLKCPASTDPHREVWDGKVSLDREARKDSLPPNRGTNVLLALSPLPLLVSTKNSPRRYPRR